MLNSRKVPKPVLILGVILIMTFHAKASDTSILSVDTFLGFSGFFASGTPVPLMIRIHNQNRDFDGTLAITVDTSSRIKSNSGSRVYQYPIQLGRGTSRQIKILLPPLTFYPVSVTITNQDGPVYEESIPIQRNRVDEQIVLLLSDRASMDDLYALSQNPLRILQPHYETLPEQWEGYRGARLVIFNNFHPNRLNQYQREALNQWVDRGGRILFTSSPAELLREKEGITPFFPFSYGGRTELKTPTDLIPAAKITPGPDAFHISVENRDLGYGILKGKGYILLWNHDLSVDSARALDENQIALSALINHRVLKTETTAPELWLSRYNYNEPVSGLPFLRENTWPVWVAFVLFAGVVYLCFFRLKTPWWVKLILPLTFSGALLLFTYGYTYPAQVFSDEIHLYHSYLNQDTALRESLYRVGVTRPEEPFIIQAPDSATIIPPKAGDDFVTFENGIQRKEYQLQPYNTQPVHLYESVPFPISGSIELSSHLLTIRLTNHQSVPIQDSVIFLHQTPMYHGTIEPGETIHKTLRLSPEERIEQEQGWNNFLGDDSRKMNLLSYLASQADFNTPVLIGWIPSDNQPHQFSLENWKNKARQDLVIIHFPWEDL